VNIRLVGNNFKQNRYETDSKQPKIHRKIHTSLWILKISRKQIRQPKVLRLLPNFLVKCAENGLKHGSGMNNLDHISESLKNNFFDTDPGWKKCGSGMEKNSDPGSIPRSSTLLLFTAMFLEFTWR
jgi:hypothetical protein